MWRDHDNVIYVEDLDEFWDSDECVYSDKLDKWIPNDQLHDLGYFECEWTCEICKEDEWAETVGNEIVSVSELKSRGWAKNDDGLWYDLESELSEQDGLEEDSTEGDK